jgi:hypothetical protein
MVALAGTAQAEIKVIYPPHSYEPVLEFCTGYYDGYGGCGCYDHYYYRRHHRNVRVGVMASQQLPFVTAVKRDREVSVGVMLSQPEAGKKTSIALILPPPLND